MKDESQRGWTVHFVRQDGTGSHTLRTGRPATIAILVLVVLVTVGGGFGLGLLTAAQRESSRVRELEADVARLEGERTRVEELAARLEDIESGYRKVQRAMGGEIARSGRDVALPPVAGRPRGSGLAGGQESVPLRPTVWPLAERGFVTRRFGAPGEPSEGRHPGLDIAIPLGSYVRAAGGGVVAESGTDSVYGYYVRIAHRDGLSSLYGHNAWNFVTEGDSVETLQVIALSGNTGRSTAPHLHFEIREGGDPIDPLAHVPIGR